MIECNAENIAIVSNRDAIWATNLFHTEKLQRYELFREKILDKRVNIAWQIHFALLLIQMEHYLKINDYF